MRSRLVRGATEEWDAFYRRYQRTLAEGFLIPMLARWGVPLDDAAVLEVGCGDGGCGAAFAAAGCRVTMIDIDERLVGVARALNEREGIAAEVAVGDVLAFDGALPCRGPFDLVLFRDVIEHLADPAVALRGVRKLLSERGCVFVEFPPYYSPYGAHQQLLPRARSGRLTLARLPYVHLLPLGVFERLIAGEGPMHREVARLRRIRLTLGRFERCVGQAGFEIARGKAYLSRPSFALRLGLPVVGAGVLGRIALLRELVVTGACYLLTPRGASSGAKSA